MQNCIRKDYNPNIILENAFSKIFLLLNTFIIIIEKIYYSKSF